jgi:hypothetical protein
MEAMVVSIQAQFSGCYGSVPELWMTTSAL